MITLRCNWPIWALMGVTLATRIVIIDWTLPYPGDPAHEHSFFYDSGLVIHDQYKVLRALANLPRGPFVEAVDAAWPVLQRYLAAVPLGLWFAADYGWDMNAVMSAPYVEAAYKTLFVNRLVSVVSSIISIFLLWKLLRRFLPETLSFFLIALFALTVSEIGSSIHEKTISLVTVMYLAEALLLERWSRNRGYEFKYLWWAIFFVGLATAAREYGLLFGGLLAALVIVFVLGEKTFSLLITHYSLLVVLALLAGIALGSPDIFVEIPYWTAAVLEPGGRAWHSTSLPTVPQELWALAKLLLGGSLGTLLFAVATVYMATSFRRHRPFGRAVLVWIVVYLIIFIFYPLKDPRFVAGLIPFVFLIIGIFLHNLYLLLRSRVVIQRLATAALALWFIQALLWATSALVFFNGQDTRLWAAEEFNATIPAGTSVAAFFPPYHTLHVPVDESKFRHFQYDDLHSIRDQMLFIESGREEQLARDSRAEFIGESGIWPRYVVIDYETGAYTYPSDQVSKHKFRDSILASNQYELIKTYPKRMSFLGGLFTTKSRWVYLNPVVEIYKLKTSEKPQF